MNKHGYPVSRSKGVYVYLHKLVCPSPLGFFTDHISGNKQDNTRENLRVVTPAQSAKNVSGEAGSSSHYKGVAWYEPSQQWRVQMRVGGINRTLGYFKDEHAAALFYDFWATDVQGEFARTNFKVVVSQLTLLREQIQKPQ